MKIGDIIRRRRKELKMSADELASKLSKDRSTIYRYENGDIENLPLDILEPIAKALDMDPQYLMGWEKNGIVYHCPDDENPYEVMMREAFDTLDVDGQKQAADMVVNYAENGKSPDQLILTEGEKAFIKLLRRVPAAEQPIVIEKILSALDNQE